MICWLNGRLFTGLQLLQYMMWLSSIIDCFDFWRPTASTCCWCLAVPKKNITNANRKNMFQAQMMFLKLQTALLNVLQNLIRLSKLVTDFTCTWITYETWDCQVLSYFSIFCFLNQGTMELYHLWRCRGCFNIDLGILIYLSQIVFQIVKCSWVAKMCGEWSYRRQEAQVRLSLWGNQWEHHVTSFDRVCCKFMVL